MGILNATPDSFSDGGHFTDPQRALARAEALVEAGADLIDIGGESTRPGASPVSVDDELARVVPLVAAISPKVSVPISVDTSKPEVMRAVIDAGASLINDVRALAMPGALDCVAGSPVATCVMHMQGEPQTMQQRPRYGDVVAEIESYLAQRIARLHEAGIESSRILIDPGFGFGKTLDHHRALWRALPRLAKLGCPLLIGVSRKGLIGQLTGLPVEQRDGPTAVMSALASQLGVNVVRVHDVAATRAALDLCDGLDETA
ncbi:dihydropteroate synthase [Gammaproteobacteria bacterium]|nr:dihydropteroate synthase [Gammaproteobacteria bacterium]